MLVPAALCTKPAAQSPTAWQLAAFVVELNMPGRHAPQTWSDDALPDVITYCPGVHDIHAEQLAMLVAVLNEPPAQGLHVRSLVAEPNAVTY